MTNQPNNFILQKNQFAAGNMKGPSLVSLQTTESLPPPTLWIFSFGSNNEIKEVPLWGANLPEEMISTFTTFVQIDTTDLSPHSRVVVHLKATDDSASYDSPPEIISKPQPLQAHIPKQELLRFVGKSVELCYSVGIGDEGTVRSLSREIKFRKKLESTFPVIEGVTAQGLVIADYPNGLNVDFAAVGNIQPYNDIECFWQTIIIVDNTIIPLYTSSVVVSSKDGEPYRFHIPAEAFTGFPKGAISSCGVSTNLLPRGFNFVGWGFGGNSNIILI